MTIRISKSATAEIAHFLPGHPNVRNRLVHGHSLIVTVTAEGERQADSQRGMVQDFGIFGRQVEAVVGCLDHACLNEVFPDIEPPTIENIAEWVALRMIEAGGPRIVSVKVDRPTCRESAEWLP